MTDASAIEQRRLLADSVADYCRRSDPLRRARALRDTEPGFDRAAWEEMAALGWLGVTVPEAFGGLGLTMADHAVLARGLSAAMMPEPLTATLIAARAIAGCADSALKASLLQGVVSGAILPVLAWQAAPGDIDPARSGVVAAPDPAQPDGLRLEGCTRFVVGAIGADGYVVSVREGAAPALCWVPATTPGVSCAAQRLADGRPVADLRFEAVCVPAASRLASGEAALQALASALDDGQFAIAAELLGLSQRLLDITLDYLRTRSQFGRPIGAFQSLQHRAVDLYIHQRIGDAAFDQALRQADTGDGLLRAACASRAKARACETARHITREAIQLHGAIGFTDDCDVGLFVKRALVLSAWLGNARLHRSRYAQQVPLDPAQG
jgi:alkylation response protein AidB-like acyl-CoA dehydrogenase